jgi:hypothetical protein
MPFREASATTCVVYLFLTTALLAGTTGWLLARFGAPARWPAAWRAGMVVAALLVAVVWWWIDKAVEGSAVVSFGDDHGVTKGDLLMVPALVLALVLVVSGFRRRFPEGTAER